MALSNALDSTHGVQSQANSGSAGGTMYYINLGGIKLCWGTTASLTGTTGSNFNVTFPTSFFSATPQMGIASLTTMTGTANNTVGVNGMSATTGTLTTYMATSFAGQVYSYLFVGI